jgi:hypothetical protein
MWYNNETFTKDNMKLRRVAFVAIATSIFTAILGTGFAFFYFSTLTGTATAQMQMQMTAANDGGLNPSLVQGDLVIDATRANCTGIISTVSYTAVPDMVTGETATSRYDVTFTVDVTLDAIDSSKESLVSYIKDSVLEISATPTYTDDAAAQAVSQTTSDSLYHISVSNVQSSDTTYITPLFNLTDVVDSKTEYEALQAAATNTNIILTYGNVAAQIHA